MTIEERLRRDSIIKFTSTNKIFIVREFFITPKLGNTYDVLNKTSSKIWVIINEEYYDYKRVRE